MGRNHRSTPGGAGVDPQRGGAAKKNLDPYLTPKGDEPMRTLLEASRYAAMVLPGNLLISVLCEMLQVTCMGRGPALGGPAKYRFLQNTSLGSLPAFV